MTDLIITPEELSTKMTSTQQQKHGLSDRKRPDCRGVVSIEGTVTTTQWLPMSHTGPYRLVERAEEKAMHRWLSDRCYSLSGDDRKAIGLKSDNGAEHIRVGFFNWSTQLWEYHNASGDLNVERRIEHYNGKVEVLRDNGWRR